MAIRNKSIIPNNIFKSLRDACTQAGTNLTEACKVAGVERSTVERWKTNEPATIKNIRKVEAAIETISKRRKC